MQAFSSQPPVIVFDGDLEKRKYIKLEKWNIKKY